MDLAIAGDSGPSVLLGHGDGTFQPAVGRDVRLSGIATGDFNGDGQLDLVTVDDRWNMAAIVSIWMNACGSAGPGLNIKRDGASISISWPAAPMGSVSTNRHLLEFSTSFATAMWLPVNLRAGHNNGRWELTMPVNQSQSFFRLRKP
jgi:hypothetical protein